jgi:hypothetical protein
MESGPNMHIHDKPMEVQLLPGEEVYISGPGPGAWSMTVDAAEESSTRLLAVVDLARKQAGIE